MKTLDGTTYTYRVRATTTVQELKAMVTKDTAIPARLQRIIFRGKVRSPDASPHAHGVTCAGRQTRAHVQPCAGRRAQPIRALCVPRVSLAHVLASAPRRWLC